MEFEPTYPDWLLSVILIGFFAGAFVLGGATFFTASDSDFFSPGDQAFFGAFVGAIGGALLGFLAWATAALVVLIRRAAKRWTRPSIGT